MNANKLDKLMQQWRRNGQRFASGRITVDTFMARRWRLLQSAKKAGLEAQFLAATGSTVSL